MAEERKKMKHTEDLGFRAYADGVRTYKVVDRKEGRVLLEDDYGQRGWTSDTMVTDP